MLWREPKAFVLRYRWALAALLVAATFDAITTYHNAVAYGTDVETHLVQRWVHAALGPAMGVPVAKVIQLGFVLLVAAWWKPWCRWVLWICASLYAAAAVSNHFLLL